MFQVFECDNLNLIAKFFGVVSPHEFDMENIGLDREMPNINGYEFLEKVKQDKRYRNITVIMLTTVSQKEKMIEAIRSGAKQYITKPFTSETLLTNPVFDILF